MRTNEEILNRYKHLYSLMERSEDSDIMNVFGKAEQWAFARMLEISADDAKRWLEKLEPTEWNNYLSREEANQIVSSFVNQDGTRGAHCSYESVKQEVEKNGWDLSDEPYFNCYALWVTMNMIYSDHSISLSEYIGEDELVKFIYKMSTEKLRDRDRERFIRDYFDL